MGPLAWAELKSHSRAAVLLAGAAMIAVLPMFFHQFQWFGGSLFEFPPTAAQALLLASKQAVMVFALALPCALVGLLYAERLRLPGLGHEFFRWLGAGLVAGLLFTPLSYLVLDRILMDAVPQLYPPHWPTALADMLGHSVAQEIIVRFGLLTIFVYLLRWRGFHGHPWPALAVPALFGSFGSYLFLLKFGLAAQLAAGQLALALGVTFALQWLYGEIYLRYGLFAALGVHFGFNLKLLVYSLL